MIRGDAGAAGRRSPGRSGAPNDAALVDEAALPFPSALFDRVLAVHALEESDSPLAVLTEIGRVLAPSGRLILVVAARHGLWTNAEQSPFGHGRPFSRRQLEALVREADLEPVGWTRALYAPPLPWATRWAEGFEQVGARLWTPLAGLILMEAQKQTLAARPIPVRVRARVLRASAALRRSFPRGDRRPDLEAARTLSARALSGMIGVHAGAETWVRQAECHA